LFVAVRPRSFLLNALRIWLPMAVALSVLAGLVYAEVQQALRSSANDPQIQMVEDGVVSLDAGRLPRDLVGSNRVDLAKSLAPFLIVFDKAGHPVASSAVLAGKTPTPPSGVLDTVRDGGQDRLTWQPQEGVRIAAVVAAYKQGFVLAGRSLILVEERESNALLLAVLGWLSGLVASALAALSVSALGRR
jgi:hypothetical protein